MSTPSSAPATATTSLWGGGPWQDPARRSEALEVAAEVEELGFARLWMSGGFGDGVDPVFGDLLGATSTLGLASGIITIWTCAPEQAAAATAEFAAAHPGRFLLGLGNSHAPLVEGQGQDYAKPYSRTVEYVRALDALGSPADGRVLAALGPKMLELSRDHARGAHPYFTTPEHTAFAREVLGAGPLLAPEVAVVLEPDADTARGIARGYMEMYLQLPNYTNNLRRFGWEDDDLLGGGSDRLVDTLIPWGSLEHVVSGIGEHVAAGADEVAVQVLTGDGSTFPRRQFRELAEALIG